MLTVEGTFFLLTYLLTYLPSCLFIYHILIKPKRW